jgi:hypothetical protein
VYQATFTASKNYSAAGLDGIPAAIERLGDQLAQHRLRFAMSRTQPVEIGSTILKVLPTLKSHAARSGGSECSIRPAAWGFPTKSDDQRGGARAPSTLVISLSALRNSLENRYETETTSRPDRHLAESPGKFC